MQSCPVVSVLFISHPKYNIQNVTTNKKRLDKEGVPPNLEEGSPPGEHGESNGNGDAEKNSKEPWLDRHINSLTAVLGCGPLISPPTIECGDESHVQSKSTDVDTTSTSRHERLSPPSSRDNGSTDNGDGDNTDVSILYWSQKNHTLTNAESLEPTALHSSSSDDKESQDSRNDSKQQTRSETKNKIFQRRLCWIICSLLLILGVLLAIFLPSWNGRFPIKRSSSMAATTAIASPTFAPTTGKPSMAPTFGDPAIVLTFLFDDFPEEIAWEVVDSNAGMVVDDFPALGYEPGIKTISHRIPVTMDREYILTISDDGLDGLCCKTPGEYFVTFRGQELVSGGGNFGAKISHTFTIPEIM